ncbi:MAG TPA: glycosyl hydrolase [Verrucomicrobiae bacterium]
MSPGQKKKTTAPKGTSRRVFCACFLSLLTLANTGTADNLDARFAQPPLSARLRAYWWWLNGNVTREAITRDLEEMKLKGFGGALICDAGGAEQDGNEQVPHGPTFMTPEWRGLYRHTLKEAERLGLEMSLNIQSGWNLGGPMVTADDAAKKLTWSETQVAGPTRYEKQLPIPKSRDDYYRDAWLVGFRLKEGASGAAPQRRPIQNWQEKAGHKALHFSAPDTTPLFQELPTEPGEEDTRSTDVVDLSSHLGKDGVLRWEVPDGTWQILRFGGTIGDHSRVSTSSDGWKGYALDVLDAAAFKRYWEGSVVPLITDAGPLAGKTLKYLHTDSWEVEPLNWTPSLRDEFRNRRGYDLLPFVPVLAGRIVDSRPISNRFLHDFRKTIGDLAIDNHFKVFRDLAHERGLQIHPESGGPHAVPIDAQRCLGWNDAPMSEFWAWSWRHRVGDENRFFVKQPASAAHTYGHPLVLAEGFTTIGPHWQETIWDNLKPSFDKALCEGLNLLVWHAFVCSPAEMGMPGQQYFAGTHFNPNSTWWSKSAAFLGYINRCQALLQEGLFVADACYYYGDHVPNFAHLKRSDPARVLPGYDYDVISEEAVLTRLSVRDGRLCLPDGMSYRVLVLPDRRIIALPVLRKLKELAAAGATVIGPKPAEASGLQDFPQSDMEAAALADELWPSAQTNQRTSNPVLETRFGNGRVISGRGAREVLLGDGVPPDFEANFEARGRSDSDSFPVGNVMATNSPPPLPSALRPSSPLDFIHRRTDSADIYFVANRSNTWEQARCTFRVTGKAPEIWDAVTGHHRFAADYQEKDGRTIVPLEFSPCGSWFVIFREPASRQRTGGGTNSPRFEPRAEINGPWTVEFDTKWGGPASVQFDQLVSWTARAEPGIKYYSGAATYRKQFDFPQAAESARPLWLDLGNLRELAEVRLNGKSLGIVWAPPFRVEISGLIRPKSNRIEIEVVNFWPNRIIGDQFLPADRRFTRTNIRKLTKGTALMESGLLGPVRILRQP